MTRDALHAVRQWQACAVAAAAMGLALGAPSAAAAPSEPAGAEYAIRWNASDGGPKTGGAALTALKKRAPRTSQLEVSYFELPPPPTAPPGFAAILRRRVEGDRDPEFTWKLRGDRALADWTCPLENAQHSKSEVDVTFSGADTITRTYSYSCTSTAMPFGVPGRDTSRRSCAASVKRWEAGRLNVEEWRLEGDVVIIEVSGKGADTPAAMEDFRRRVAAPLLAAGVVPSPQSKTDLATRCQ
jgi:hypothetical protein